MAVGVLAGGGGSATGTAALLPALPAVTSLTTLFSASSTGLSPPSSADAARTLQPSALHAAASGGTTGAVGLQTSPSATAVLSRLPLESSQNLLQSAEGSARGSARRPQSLVPLQARPQLPSSAGGTNAEGVSSANSALGAVQASPQRRSSPQRRAVSGSALAAARSPLGASASSRASQSLLRPLPTAFSSSTSLQRSSSNARNPLAAPPRVGSRPSSSVVARQAPLRAGKSGLPTRRSTRDGKQPGFRGSPASSPSSSAAAEKAAMEVEDVCAICLEELHSHVFSFPCGNQHKMHYRCTLHFLRCTLAVASGDRRWEPGQSPQNVGLADEGSAESPFGASLQPSVDATSAAQPESWNVDDEGSPHFPRPSREVTRMFKDVGFDFRAIDSIERVVVGAGEATLREVRCPMCRASWPECKIAGVKEPMASLRAVCAKKLAPRVEKLTSVLSKVYENFDEGLAWQRYRAGRGFQAIDSCLRSAGSFFSHLLLQPSLNTSLLSLFHIRDVYRLSPVSTAIGALCRRAGLLRVPHLRTWNLARAVANVAAPDVATLQVEPRSRFGHDSSKSMGSSATRDLADWLSGSGRLSELYLSSIDWEGNDPGGFHLAKCVASKNLRVLDLSYNCLTDVSVARLAESLLQNDGILYSLVVLLLDLNEITHVGLDALMPLGKGNVRTWGLKHNKLSDDGCLALASSLPKSAAWDLRTNKLGPVGCELLAPIFQHMTVARLGCNPVGDDGACHLARFLGSSLRILDLRQARIGEPGAVQLGGGLRLGRCTALEEFLLSGNLVASAGAQALAEGLARAPALKVVELSNNPLGCLGVKQLAQEMPYWRQSPLRIALLSVECCDEGARALLTAVRSIAKSRTGWTVDLAQNDLDPHFAAEIRKLLE